MGDREVDCRTLESKDNAMNDLVASMRHEASEYEFDQYAATLLLKAADRIEELEAELVAANATIKLVYDALERRALSATPKPADNSEDDQC